MWGWRCGTLRHAGSRLYFNIDKAGELLSHAIDMMIGGATRGFLGSWFLGWFAGSPRYLRQVNLELRRQSLGATVSSGLFHRITSAGEVLRSA